MWNLSNSLHADNLIFNIVAAAVFALVIWVLLRINRALFRRAQQRRQGLHLRFFERLSSIAIVVAGVILAFSFWGGLDSVWKTLLGGTAILSAVLAFAAQDVIKDVLAGLMISLNRPFEIGNRIQLEDGTVGVVKDITPRHVVILGLDGTCTVVPNSKLNAMSLINYSYQVQTRSARFDFHIAYGSDVEKAMAVIRQAVTDSPYSVPGKPTENGPDYAPVYFMAYEDSSLRLATTVYFEAVTASEILISDVNLRVGHALAENGIEIPYTYINVVQVEGEKE